MLQFKKNLLRNPPEGWHYIDGDETIRGETRDEVERKIAAYRVRNGKPPGDPHQDMINFWFVKRPEFLEHAPEGTDKPEISGSSQLGGVLQWLQRLTQQGSDLEVGRGVTEERVAICLECPCNVSVPGDQSLKSEIDRRSFMLRKGEVMPALHICSCHVVDLRVAVRLRMEFLNPNPGQPQPCWLRKG